MPVAGQQVLYERSLDRWGRILSESHGGQRDNLWPTRVYVPVRLPIPMGHHSGEYRYYKHMKHALVEIKNADNQRPFSHDAVGRLTSVQDDLLDDKAGLCLRYLYNSEGKLIRETVGSPRHNELF